MEMGEGEYERERKEDRRGKREKRYVCVRES